MSHVIACPKCNQQYQLQADPAGKQMKCPACQTVFTAGAKPAVAAQDQRAQQQAQQRAMQQQQAQQAAFARTGVGGHLAASPQLFPEQQAQLAPGADPLGNHIVQDPGFAAIDVDEIRRRREQEAREKESKLDKSFTSSSSLAEYDDEQQRRKQDGYLSAESLFGFEGRFSRKQFWLTALLYGLLQSGVLFAIGVFFAGVGILLDLKPGEGGLLMLIPLFVILGFTSIVNTWVSLAIHVKRLHDRNKSWVWILISLIPFGGIWLFIECGFLKGTAGKNQFGPDPTKQAA